jgi:hypothetical protein
MARRGLLAEIDMHGGAATQRHGHAACAGRDHVARGHGRTHAHCRKREREQQIAV